MLGQPPGKSDDLLAIARTIWEAIADIIAEAIKRPRPRPSRLGMERYGGAKATNAAGPPGSPVGSVSRTVATIGAKLT